MVFEKQSVVPHKVIFYFKIQKEEAWFLCSLFLNTKHFAALFLADEGFLK